MTYASASQRKLDVVAQQAQMVAFAIPFVGAELAAGASILDAVYGAYAGGEEPRDTYSAEQAIDDLGREIIKLIGTSDDANQKLISKLQLLRAQTDGYARNFKRDGSKGDATVAVTALAGNQDWKDLLNNLHDDPAAIDRTGTQTFDPTTADCCTYFPVAPTDPVPTADDVTFLDTYCQGHTAYHAVLISTLKYVAATLGLTGEADWMAIRSSLRVQLEQGLSMALDHMCKIVTKLEDAAHNGDTRARAFADAEFNKLGNGAAKPGPDWLLPYTREYRRIRNAAFLDQTTPEAVKSYRDFIDAFYLTLTGLLDPKSAPTIDPADSTAPTQPAGPGGQPTGHAGGAGPLAPLGPRQPKTARFLYESSPTGDWVAVLDNTTLGPGLVVSQNAGSAKAGIYYSVGGHGVGGLNLLFKNAITAAGQISSTDQALATAYDAKYGRGQFQADSSAVPTRQDRLTSFLVPLSVAGPIGDQVLGMVYSAAPDISATGLTDPVAYGNIYGDALAAIATWNSANPTAPIVYFRITMLSTLTNAGSFAGPALNKTVARLIVDSVLSTLAADAASAHPVLQDLIVLINNNELTNSPERTAFDAAVTGIKGLTAARDGFDIPFPQGSGPTPAPPPPPTPPQQSGPDLSTPYWGDPRRPPPFRDDREGFR